MGNSLKSKWTLLAETFVPGYFAGYWAKKNSFLYVASTWLRLGSHWSAYEYIRFCFCRYLWTGRTAPFLYKNPHKYPFLYVHTTHTNGGKDIRFCGFLSFHNAVFKEMSFFVPSHWSTAFEENFRFRNIYSVGLCCKLAFLCVFARSSVNDFTRRFTLRFCAKTMQCEREHQSLDIPYYQELEVIFNFLVSNCSSNEDTQSL